MRLRCRDPTGAQHVILVDDATATISSLKSSIAQLVPALPPTIQKLKFGFPPKDLSSTETTLLQSLGIRNGDLILVEASGATPALATAASSPPRQVHALMAPSSSAGRAPVAFSGTSSSLQAGSSASHGSAATALPPHPVGSGEVVPIVRVVPDDNSCLFSAIGYVLGGKSRSKAKQLREVVVKAIQADPISYSEAMLGKPVAQYCNWIMNDKSWGGAIEVSIFSKHFRAAIAVADIRTASLMKFGEDYVNRVYLLYDGIHYDAIAMNSVGAPEATDRTVFSAAAGDDLDIVDALMVMVAEERQQSGQFTNVAGFRLQCNDCNTILVGEKAAVEHNKKTGHKNFGEVTTK